MSSSDGSPDRLQRQNWGVFVQALNPEIDPQAIQLMEQMHRVAHTLYQIGETSLAASGLSYAKYRLLMALLYSEELEGRGQLHPSQISERQGTGRNTVSALIRDLEENGLVERHLDRKDRRKFNIKLTTAGRSLVKEHISRHFRVIADCFNGLTPDERSELSHLLGKLGEDVDGAS